MFGSRGSSRLQKGGVFPAPLPTRIVSNEEFVPPPQTSAQARVESLVHSYSGHAATRLGMRRRDFLKATGGVAAAFLAMNAVFGRFFDVLDVELLEAAAFTERQGAPFFIFDVQTHYVSSSYDPDDDETRRRGAVSKQALLGLRRRAKEMGVNPLLAQD